MPDSSQAPPVVDRPRIDPDGMAALQLFLEALPYYVIVIDDQHEVVAANSAVIGALGTTAEAMVGCYCPTAAHGVEGHYDGCPFEESVERGGPVEHEHHDAETDTWVESMIYPVEALSPAGRQMFLHFIRDISHLKRVEHELTVLKDQLELQVERRTAQLARVNAKLAERTAQAEELQREHQQVAISRERLARVGELSAGIAHTIRNPLHGLLNSVDHLLRIGAKDPEETAEVLSWMQEGLTRMEMVTRRLLALTRDAPLRRQAVDFNAMINDTLSYVSERVRDKQVKLISELAPVPAVQVDMDRLGEAVTNLLDNAIDACQGQGVVTTRTSITGDDTPALCLEIQDDGHGVPAQMLERVFDPFFTTKKIGEGSGLGLAITRRVVEEHGGTVQISSQQGRGTSIRVLLPLDHEPEPA